MQRIGIATAGIFGRATALGVAACLALLVPAGSAAATPPTLWTRCPSGSAAARCNIPRGVAADPASGHVYVADSANDRIVELTAWGAFLKAWGWDVVVSGPGNDTTPPENQLESCIPARGDVCKAGVKGGGRGQLIRPQGVALDSASDLYVVEGEFGKLRVQKFDPTAGAGEEEAQFLLMFGGKVDETSDGNLCPRPGFPEDVCKGAVGGTGNGEFGPNVVIGSFIAISSDGKVWVGDQERIQRFDTAGEYQSQIALAGETVKALAVDPTGNLYVATCSACTALDPAEPEVRKYSPTGVEVPRAFEVADPKALAVDASGNLYVLDGDTKPTLRVFDPEREELESFSAGLDASTGIATNTVDTKEGVGIYLSNSHEGSSFVEALGPPPFNWPRPEVPPSIESQFTLAATTDSATVKAQIDPRFWDDTTYWVRYGTGKCSEGGCPEEMPLPPGSKLTDQILEEALPTKAVFLSGLVPDTDYHYRFVAESSGGGPVYGVEGVEGSFHTFALSSAPEEGCPNDALRTGASARLPDCRAYEQVSPPQKDGDVEYSQTPVDMATAGGEELTFAASNPAFGPGHLSAPLWLQYIAKRGGLGWSTRSIDPPRSSLLFPRVDLVLEAGFRAFSPDLCVSFYRQDNEYPLAPGTPPGWTNIYRRSDTECGGAPDFETLIPSVPTNLLGPKQVANYSPNLLGFSANAPTAAIVAAAALTPDANPDPVPEESAEHPSSSTSPTAPAVCVWGACCPRAARRSGNPGSVREGSARPATPSPPTAR